MKNSVLFLILAFLFVLVFAGSTYYFTKKYKKQDLADYFKVSRKTVAKWVKLLPNAISFEQWNALKSLTAAEYEKLKQNWDYEGFTSMNKEQIVNYCESTYDTLAENVKLNLEKIGITEEAWKSLSIFPPVVCQRIISVMG